MNAAGTNRLRALGSARSLSQRIRSTSTAAELEQTRRRISAARTKSAKSGKLGPSRTPTRPITPKDVADRYDSAKSGRSKRAPSLSDQRGKLSRPLAPDKAASNAARIEAGRKDAAARSAKARTLAARKKGTDKSRDVRIKNARIKQGAQDAKAASNSARIEKARQSYANRVAAARRKSLAGGADGRGGTGHTAIIGNGSPIQAGGSSGRGWNGGFNGGYGYIDPYYHNSFWGYWGGGFSYGWGSFFWSPFYVHGLFWQNYWLSGGNWGGYYGWNSGGYRNNSSIWLGPFLPSTTSFIIYDDPNPEVIYVEVPAEEEPLAGEVVMQQDIVDAPIPAQASLPPEATDPGLQRELNRAAAYYLTQGDRAFREARYGDAAHFYAKAVEFSSDSGILYLVLSDALFATGDYRYAAYALRQAFDREPDLARNLVDKREFYADPAQFDRQLATLERFVEDHVLDMDARLVLAANYLFGGRPDAAWSLVDDPFSEELRGTNEGYLIQSSAHRIMFGDEGAASGVEPESGSDSSQF